MTNTPESHARVEQSYWDRVRRNHILASLSESKENLARARTQKDITFWTERVAYLENRLHDHDTLVGIAYWRDRLHEDTVPR